MIWVDIYNLNFFDTDKAVELSLLGKGSITHSFLQHANWGLKKAGVNIAFKIVYSGRGHKDYCTQFVVVILPANGEINQKFVPSPLVQLCGLILQHEHEWALRLHILCIPVPELFCDCFLTSIKS